MAGSQVAWSGTPDVTMLSVSAAAFFVAVMEAVRVAPPEAPYVTEHERTPNSAISASLSPKTAGESSSR